MCIAFWTFDDPDYALVLCSNRDEFLNRPTIDARFHSFDHHGHHIPNHEAPSKFPSDDGNDSLNNVLSGIDEVGGGTWLGLTRSGKIALLTNITEPPCTFTSTRGSLVSSFLLSEDEIHSSNEADSTSDLEKLATKLYPREAKFAGFNLLLLAPTLKAPNASASTTPDVSSGTSPTLGKMDNRCQANDNTTLSSPIHSQPETQSRSLSYTCLFLTNSGAGGPITARPLSSQEKCCGVLSNGVDGYGGNEWPKVVHGVKEMERLILEMRQKASRNDQADDGRGRPATVTSAESVTMTANLSMEEGLNDRFHEEEAQDRRLADRLFGILTWVSPDPVTERSHLRKTIHVCPIPIELKPSKASPISSTNSAGGPITGGEEIQTPKQTLASPGASPAIPVPISKSPVSKNSNPGSEDSVIMNNNNDCNKYAETDGDKNINHTGTRSAQNKTCSYYGTRLSTVLIIRRNGDVMFIEKDVWKMVNGEVVRMDKDKDKEGNLNLLKNNNRVERVFRFRLDGW